MDPTNPPEAQGSRSARSVPAGTDRYEALLEVLEQQAGRAAHEDRRPPRRTGTGRGAAALLVVLLAVTAWLWIFPPAWLIPPAVPPQSLAQEEAALRFTMYLQAQRIRAHQLEHGVLPETLEEAGEAVPGMQYRVLAGDLYELTGTSDRLRLTYLSSERLRDWVGPGAAVLDESRLP